MLTQYFVYYLIFFVIVEIDYISECSGYNVSPTSYNNLKRFKRRTGCRKIEFECDNGQCHPLQDYCDGKIDCADESDEESDCNPDGCLDNEFQCEYGACIEASAKCDGKKDCRDNSDENERLCNITLRLNECLPPIVENGNYTVFDNIEYVSGELIPNSSLVNIYCGNHNSILTKQINTIECVNGSFYQELPKCILTCATKFHYSIDVDCELDRKNEDCTKHLVRVGTIAHMKCKPNFVDNNPEITKTQCLFNGSWDVPFKQCNSPFTDKCPPLALSAVHVTCVLDGVLQDCRKEVPEGTDARMTCIPDYIDINDAKTTTAICSNGTWTSSPLKKCIPDCSGVVLEGEPFIVNGTSANIGNFPWHVAIYRRKPDEPRDYICGGSLISVKVVLSAAHCFTNQKNGKLYPSSEFSVAAGKMYSNWDADEDEHYAQKRNVESIHIPDDIYFGQLSYFAGDLAVVVVEKIFTFNNFVHAVCVDWNLEYTNQQLLNGTLGKVAGWGATSTRNAFASAELRQLRVPYVKREKCVKIVPESFISFVTTDKFCAGYTNGSSICNGDSGGGLIFSHYDDYQMKYYIQGIVSVGPTKEGACNDFQLGVYTEIRKYISFIKEIEESNTMITSVDCVVPKIRNGKVSVSGLDYTPGSSVKDSFEITIECNSGYNLSTNNLSKCIGGQWSIMPTCVTFAPQEGGECPPIIFKNGRYDVEGYPNHIPGNPIPDRARVNFRCKNDSYTLFFHDYVHCKNGQIWPQIPECELSCVPRSSTTSVDIKCEFNGGYRDCERRVSLGTIATMKCKPYYYEPARGPSTAVCMNGSWTEDLIKCNPECGELSANIEREKNKFPWHVAIWRKISNNPTKYICGGSIISVNIVLTAANCFYLGRVFILGAGRITETSFEPITDYIQNIQHRKVLKILIPRDIYMGSASNYTGNIALVVVDKPFTFTEYIRPVCVDWNSEFVGTQLRSGAMGQVARWPETSFDLDTKKITVPYIDRGQCFKTVAPQSYRRYITIDKYCAGYANESSLSYEDRGSGLVFAQNEFSGKKYYIQGVVSFGPSTDGHEIGIITRVASYIDLIKKIVALNRIN